MAAADIDEDLQSRQMAVYGRESMQKLKRANVLISGLNGLGAEVAKNVILANVNSVTLHDELATSAVDLGSNFYLTPADVGRNRAAACSQQMQELNPAVAVSVLTDAFPLERLHEWSVVVAVDMPLALALRADAACRAAGVAFIRTDVRGLCGSVFVDLGDSFTSIDPSGEAVKSAIVEHMLLEPTAAGGEATLRVQCVEDEPLELDDGEFVSFSEVQGMEPLNSAGQLPVSDVSKGKKHFCVKVPAALAASLGAHTRGGLVSEVRQPKTLSFKSLHDFLLQPGDLWEADESKMALAATSFSEEFLVHMGQPTANVCYGRSGLLHLGFRALDEFVTQRGRMPAPNDAADAEALHEMAEAINASIDAGLQVKQLHEPSRSVVLKQLASGACAVLSPMAAIFGGIVGQEVVKAATGKFHPICQAFYLDAFECLPKETPPLATCDAAAVQAAGRYGAQVAVFGSGLVERLQRLNVFLVGSGALGCEFLKGFALMGVACADGGQLTVTDDDVIEKSNLSRQFLFRNHNVGQSKSLSAVAAVSSMNPDFRARALQDRVSPQTEGVFDDDFWQRLDLVVNALDNVKARLYVDQRCVFFCKALLESGTLGTKCNTQMVVPHLTENYGASRDPPEKEAPQCAVHNFPHNIDQCLVLAHSEFVGNFESTPRDVTEFLCKGREWVDSLSRANETPASILDKLRGDARVTCGVSGGCHDVMVSDQPNSWEACVGWARRKFESYFRNRIEQLLHNFPHDAVTSQGVPFWSPPKRLPTPIVFDETDPLHLQFVMAAANLRAFMAGLATPADCRDGAAIARLLASSAACAVPRYTPCTDGSIETDNKEEDARRKAAAASAQVDESEQIEAAVAELLEARARMGGGFSPKPNEFEKDHDDNFHMDFISSFGNLRARNYGIEEVDKFQAKLKAGRIIPAIATTTAMVTGFVQLELYKELLALPLESRRNLFANLALPGPLLSLSEPMQCNKITSGQRWDPDMYMDVDEVAHPNPHTLWDSIVVRGAASMSLSQLRDWFVSERGIVLCELMLVSGGKSKAVLSTTLPSMREANAVNCARNLAELITEVCGAPPGGLYPLEGAIFETPDGDAVKAARVVLAF